MGSDPIFPISGLAVILPELDSRLRESNDLLNENCWAVDTNRSTHSFLGWSGLFRRL
jgi:hypothetical protein